MYKYFVKLMPNISKFYLLVTTQNKMIRIKIFIFNENEEVTPKTTLVQAKTIRYFNRLTFGRYIFVYGNVSHRCLVMGFLNVFIYRLIDKMINILTF